LGVLMVAAGVGLLKMMPWARTLSIIYAILSILSRVATAIYTIGYVLPATNAAMETLLQGNAQLAAALSTFKAITYAIFVISQVFIIYPLFVLIVMFLPSVRRAFAEGGWERDRDEDRDEDRDGDREDYHDRWSDRGPEGERGREDYTR